MAPLQVLKEAGQLLMLVVHSVHAAPCVTWALHWFGLPGTEHGMWHVLGSACVLTSLVMHIIKK